MIVFGELSTNTAVNLEETLPKIKEKIRANNSKIHDFVVDPESFQFIGSSQVAAEL